MARFAVTFQVRENIDSPAAFPYPPLPIEGENEYEWEKIATAPSSLSKEPEYIDHVLAKWAETETEAEAARQHRIAEEAEGGGSTEQVQVSSPVASDSPGGGFWKKLTSCFRIKRRN